MGAGRIIGFRVSEELYDRLHEMAIDKNTSISDVLRDLVINNIDMSYQFSQWEIIAWNLFNINADQLNYAKRAATVADQFFSIVSKWSKDTIIRVIPHPDLVMVEFKHKGKSYLIQESRILPKIQIIQGIVDTLGKQIEESFLPGGENETQSVCNRTDGESPGTADEKQPNEFGPSLSESFSSKGHPDVSDLISPGLDKGPTSSE